MELVGYRENLELLREAFPNQAAISVEDWQKSNNTRRSSCALDVFEVIYGTWLDSCKNNASRSR